MLLVHLHVDLNIYFCEMKFCLGFLLLIISLNTSAQDSTSFNSYRENFILYSDLSFKAAPFSIHDNLNLGVKKIAFKHNFSPALGFGFAYKWLGLRISFALPGHMRPVSRYGKSNFIDLGIKFNIKRTYWDIDFRNYQGYVINDAYKWNDTLTGLTPNDVRPGQNATSFSINSWIFKNKNYHMNGVLGIKGDYAETEKSWYFKSTLNIFGISNTGGPITPAELIDTAQTKSFASTLSALDIGLVPGYAYTHRYKNWQVSALGGLGLVLQGKFNVAQEITRSYLGIAPRIDMRVVGGYTKARYFFLLFTDFDIKSIRFQEMRYRQVYYQIGVLGGYRFKKKEKDKRK